MKYRAITRFFLVLLLLSLVSIQSVNADETLIFSPIADAYVLPSKPDDNNEPAEYLWVSLNSSLAFILFDLSDIPADAYIKSVQLQLKVKYLGTLGLSPIESIWPNRVAAFQSLNTSWSETEITWNNKPEVVLETLDYDSANTLEDLCTWKITDAVTVGENLTVVLKAWDNKAGFYPRESEYGPELEIIYTMERPPEPPILLIQVIVAICAIAVVGAIIYIKVRHRKK